MVLALLLGCIKPAAPIGDGDGAPVVLVAVADPAGGETFDAPESFDAAILSVLADRKLAGEEGTAPWVPEFQHRHDSRQRIALLTAPGDGRDGAGAAATLLLELQPAYYSELSGQYRWTVAVHATVIEHGAAALDSRFDVPVFLRYHHEREAEAVAASAPVVARHVGELLDTWLTAR
jgi:hypothetical protein